MDIVISNKSDIPIPEQLYEQISSQIAVGKLPQGYPMPSVRTLAKELGISIMTVQKAYEMLEAKDFIYTKAGKGSFVRSYTKAKLDDKREQLALEKLKENIPYYKSLNVSLDELIEMIKRAY